MTAEHAKPAEDADQTAKRLRAALLGASVRGDSAALDAAVRESATLCGITKQHTLAAWVRVLRARARDDGVEEGRGGAVAVIQRFGGALNLNVHVHALVLDGVFARHRAGALSFHPIRRLTTLDVAEVLATVEPLIMRRLERRGFGPGDGEADAPDAWANEAPVLAGLAAASVQGTIALGPRRGARLRRLGDAAEPVETPAPGHCHARANGFDLHAGLAGNERTPALSPDGNQVAFAWDGEKGDNIGTRFRISCNSPTPDSQPFETIGRYKSAAGETSGGDSHPLPFP